MNLDPALCLKPRNISIWKVINNVSVGPIQKQLTEFVDHEGFRYLTALNNHSKHRSIVDIPFSLDVTATPGPSGLKFAAFEYEDDEFPDRWAMPSLDAEYGRQSTLIIGIGRCTEFDLDCIADCECRRENPAAVIQLPPKPEIKQESQ